MLKHVWGTNIYIYIYIYICISLVIYIALEVHPCGGLYQAPKGQGHVPHPTFNADMRVKTNRRMFAVPGQE